MTSIQLQLEIVHYTIGLKLSSDLILNEPFEFEHAYYRPYSTEGGKETLKIVGIDGTTGDLLCKNRDGESRFVYYNELTLKELTQLHNSVLQQEYVLQILI